MTGTSSRAPSAGTGSTRQLRPAWVVAGVLVVVAVVFIAQNRGRVSMHLFAATLSAPMWLLLSSIALVGAAVGALLRARR
jgi:putative membrane protein